MNVNRTTRMEEAHPDNAQDRLASLPQVGNLSAPPRVQNPPVITWQVCDRESSRCSAV